MFIFNENNQTPGLVAILKADPGWKIGPAGSRDPRQTLHSTVCAGVLGKLGEAWGEDEPEIAPSPHS